MEHRPNASPGYLICNSVEFIGSGFGEGSQGDVEEQGKVEVGNNSFICEDISAAIHSKYNGELYSLIVSLTSGEAKCVVRGILEKGGESDGFCALASVQNRFGANTAASLLQCVMEAVNLPQVKNHQGILKGITEWEVRVDSLKSKRDEVISPSVKIAILVGFLPAKL